MKQGYGFNKSKISIFISAAIIMTVLKSSPVSAEVQFNPDFINAMTGGDIDISKFNGAYKVYPGTYEPDVYLNGSYIGRSKVVVTEEGDSSRICFDQRLLNLSNIKTDVIPQQALTSLQEAGSCQTLQSIIPQAEAQLNVSDMRFDLSIPQAFLDRHARGYVPPALWTHGETGIFTNYSTNYFEQHNGSEVNRSFYGDLRGGVNAGPWLIRHSGSFRWNEHRAREYNVYSTTLQRDIVQWNSRFLLGDSNTSGEVFDSFSFRGAQLSSVEQMLPDSLRGYAPVVRGIAKSNAKITIRQRGTVIYETTVPAGEFLINDLYPTGYGGDLDVEVTEADGSVSSFSVPYSSLTQLLRPGLSNYNVTVGKIRNLNVADSPYVMQVTYKRGINNLITAYSGLAATSQWKSAVVGSAFGTPIGAFALDVTGTHFRYKEEEKKGASIRASFNKYFASTDSSISLAAYRFSSSGYTDLYNSVFLKNHLDNDNDGALDFNKLNRPKNRYSLTLSQSLGDYYGQFYISGFRENYWNQNQNNTQYQFGYNNNYKMLTYGLAVNKNITVTGAETQYMFNFSLPLGRYANLNSFTTHGKSGTKSQLGASGIAGERDQMNYSASISKDTQNDYSTDLSGTYTFPQTTLSGGYSLGKGFYALSGGLSGSLVGFSEGVILSPYNNLDTIAIVSAEHAGGATIDGYPNVVLNSQGYAVVPYLNPYRLNQVSINPKGLSYDVEIDNSIQQVAPHYGAMVKVDYPTRRGRTLLIRAQLPDGNALPFGASVKKRNGEEVGIVAQGGQIYVRLEAENEYLSVHWGRKNQQYCGLPISVGSAPAKPSHSFKRLSLVCQPQGSDPLSGATGTTTEVAALVGSSSNSSQEN